MENELELMRKQFAILNDKVSKQKILTDRLIEKVMKKNVSIVKRLYIVELVCALYVITFGSWSFYEMEFSLPFIISTIVFMLVCGAATIFVGKDVFANTMQEGTMLEIMQKALRAKKLEQNWLFIGIPLGLAWFGWICWESYQMGNYPLIYGISFGALIGAAIGFRNYKRTIGALNDIVENIEDLQSTEEE